LNILCSTAVVNMKFARAPHQVCPPPRVWGGRISLQGELGAIIEETVRRVTPRTSTRSVFRQQTAIEGGGSSKFFKSQSLYEVRLRFFQVSQPIWGESLEFFHVPEPIWGGGAQNFPKPQGIYTGRKIYDSLR